jgi:DMSO/TMAO reductase YedYZ molybdopterin-dependent catalytic subunit
MEELTAEELRHMQWIKTGFHGQLPARPHDLVERITPTEKCIVLCHLGVPDLRKEGWVLSIDGMVGRPQVLTFDDLKRFPKAVIQSVHQCAGSPLDPHRPTQRVCNVVWAGARLQDILESCAVKPGARYLWSRGADSGEFAGVACGDYLKDLPLDRLDRDVLVAYEMNGEPLRPEHGYPARLVVPGFYGTNSVKWLLQITLAGSRASSPFTTRWYNDQIEGGTADSVTSTPVWALAPQSIIVMPGGGMVVPADHPFQIWGWAWGDQEIARVQVVGNDPGESWREADIEPRTGRAWQKFSLSHPGVARGRHMLRSVARSIANDVQPIAGARNAVFEAEFVAE